MSSTRTLTTQDSYQKIYIILLFIFSSSSLFIFFFFFIIIILFLLLLLLLLLLLFFFFFFFFFFSFLLLLPYHFCYDYSSVAGRTLTSPWSYSGSSCGRWPTPTPMSCGPTWTSCSRFYSSRTPGKTTASSTLLKVRGRLKVTQYIDCYHYLSLFSWSTQ